MELTEQDKATLMMLGMTPEQYQDQFPLTNQSGQRFNFAGQTLDDYFISMLDKDAEFELRSDPELRTYYEEERHLENELTKKGAGLGSVQPKTIVVPNPFEPVTPKLADTLRLLQDYQMDLLYQSGVPLPGSTKSIKKYTPPPMIKMTPKIEEREFEKLKLQKLEEVEKK